MSTDDTNGSTGAAEKKFSINFSKERQNFALFCVTMVIIVICLLKENKYTSLKQITKM